jgi:hypothetical protein
VLLFVVEPDTYSNNQNRVLSVHTSPLTLVNIMPFHASALFFVNKVNRGRPSFSWHKDVLPVLSYLLSLGSDFAVPTVSMEEDDSAAGSVCFAVRARQVVICRLVLENIAQWSLQTAGLQREHQHAGLPTSELFETGEALHKFLRGRISLAQANAWVRARDIAWRRLVATLRTDGGNSALLARLHSSEHVLQSTEGAAVLYGGEHQEAFASLVADALSAMEEGGHPVPKQGVASAAVHAMFLEAADTTVFRHGDSSGGELLKPFAAQRGIISLQRGSLGAALEESDTTGAATRATIREWWALCLYKPLTATNGTSLSGLADAGGNHLLQLLGILTGSCRWLLIKLPTSDRSNKDALDALYLVESFKHSHATTRSPADVDTIKNTAAVLVSYGITIVDGDDAQRKRDAARHAKNSGVWGLGMGRTVGTGLGNSAARQSGECHDDGRMTEVSCSSISLGNKNVQTATCIHAAVGAPGVAVTRNGGLIGAALQLLLIQLFVPASIDGTERDYLAMVALVSYFNTTLRIGGTGSHTMVAAGQKSGSSEPKSSSNGDDDGDNDDDDDDDVVVNDNDDDDEDDEDDEDDDDEDEADEDDDGDSRLSRKSKSKVRTARPRGRHRNKRSGGRKKSKAATGGRAVGVKRAPTRMTLRQQASHKEGVSKTALAGAQAGIPFRVYAIFEHEALAWLRKELSESAIKRLEAHPATPGVLQKPRRRETDAVEKKRRLVLFAWALIGAMFDGSMAEYAAAGVFEQNNNTPLTLTPGFGVDKNRLPGQRSPRFIQACRLAELAQLSRDVLLEPLNAQTKVETAAMNQRLFRGTLNCNKRSEDGPFSPRSPAGAVYTSWQKVLHSNESQLWVGMGLFNPILTGRVRQALRQPDGGPRVVERFLKTVIVLHPIDPTCTALPCKGLLDVEDLVRVEREREREREREPEREREAESQRKSEGLGAVLTATY